MAGDGADRVEREGTPHTDDSAVVKFEEGDDYVVGHPASRRSSQRSSWRSLSSPSRMSPMMSPDSSDSEAPPTPAERLESSKQRRRETTWSQVKALLKKNYPMKYKRFSNIALLLLEILVPFIFFFLMSVGKLAKPNKTEAGNDATDLLKYQKTSATTGSTFPIMDPRWTASADESEGLNYCSYMGGAGSSLGDIFSVFSNGKGAPKFSPSNKLLFSPNDEEHTALMRGAAKRLLCSRTADETKAWPLRNLNAVTQSVIPDAFIDNLALGKAFTRNQTNSYMDIITGCNYLYYLYNDCLTGEVSIRDSFFESIINPSPEDKERGTNPTDIVLSTITDIIRTNATEFNLFLKCLDGVSAEGKPQLQILKTILDEDPCQETCLNDESCIGDVLDLFLVGFPSERDAVKYVEENPMEAMGVVSFDSSLSSSDESFAYTLRVNGTDIAPVGKEFVVWQSMGAPAQFHWWKGYYSFVNMQHAVDKAIADLKENGTAAGSSNGSGEANGSAASFVEENIVMLSPYPSLEITTISVDRIANMGMGIIFGIAWLCTIVIQTYNLVFEKQTNLQEFQFIMGLNPALYWVMHFFVSYIPQIIIAVVVGALAGQEDPIGGFIHSSWTVLMVFFLVFQASLTAFVAACSALFDKVATACIGMVMIWVVSLLPGLLVCTLYPGGNAAWLIVGILPASNAFSFGQHVMQMESIREGVQWNNMTKSILGYGDINTQTYFLIAAFDVAFYVFLVWICSDKKYEKIYDFVKAKVCCRFLSGAEDSFRLSGNNEPRKKDVDLFQQLKTRKIPTVQLDVLRKVYPNGVEALKGLSMSMYEGEVTALLGSNGAGKSTTISILTGRLKPTSGDARILGKSLLKDLSLIRRGMGVCTQHDSLWPLMTVKEHMVYFSYIKGLTARVAVEEMRTTLSQLDILHQTDTLSKNLSGGQRRKLNLSLALLGSPYFILLDEPSTGMDPKSRKDTWDFIKDAKRDRVILITTHYMDEAEVLGDKIAIMSHGSLKCWGTPSFLKSSLRLGYQLRFLCNEAKPNPAIEKVVNDHTKSANFEPMAGSELKILLPESERKRFPELLRSVASKENELNVESYGLVCTTMEDTFLQIVKTSSLRVGDSAKLEKQLTDVEKNMKDSSDFLNNNFAILLWKRFLYLKREAVLNSVQFVAIIFMMILGCGVLSTVVTPKIPTTQKPELVTARLNLEAPPSEVAVAQNASDANSIYESMENFYAEDFSLRYSLDAQNESEFQDALASNITNQKVSCNKASMQTCASVYIEDGNGGEGEQYTLLFSQSAFHSPAASVNLFDSYVLRKENENSTLGIEVTNHPLPLVGVQRKPSIQDYIQQSNITFTAIILGLAVLATWMATHVTYEKRFGANSLQILSGTHPLTYHLSNYLWEFCVFCFVSVFIFLVFFLMPTRSLFNFPHGLDATIYLILLFGPACISFGYLLQTPFQSEMMSFGMLFGINAIVGLILFDVAAILVAISFPEFSPSSVTVQILNIIEWIFPLHPVFAVTRGIFEVTWFAIYRAYPILCSDVFYCSVYGPYKPEDAGRSIVMRMIVFLAAEAVGYMALFLAIEFDLFSIEWLRRRKHKFVPRDIDEDVSAERDRVMGVAGKSKREGDLSIRQLPDEHGRRDLVIIRNLWVAYGKRMILKGLSFGLKEGRCFGLLGVNGAGKSTFFKILTGATGAAHGEVLICRDGQTIDLLKAKGVGRSKLVGYCPQSDALLPKLTVVEQLQIYGVIKGMGKADIATSITTLVTSLGLRKFQDKQIGSLSGGNRRKVSVAVSLLGEPALVLLDEPSAGLDPASRRSLWNAITNSTMDKTVVLTSHSMEECEALCDYVGLMSSGEFHAFGTITHLKERFGRGYCGKLYVGFGRMLNVLNYLENTAWLHVDEVCGSEIRVILGSDIDLATVFEELEKVFTRGDIMDYSVSPTTLDEIFLGFAGGLLQRNFVCRTELAVSVTDFTYNEEVKNRLSIMENRSHQAASYRRSKSFGNAQELGLSKF